MGLYYAGIDEAGYGPLLGPLCVALCVLKVDDWREGDGAPDLWKLLDAIVCKEPAAAGKRGRFERLAINDSKKLKLSNGLVTKDPLTHLERGVVTLLNCQDSALAAHCEVADAERPVATPTGEAGDSWLERGDAGYFERIGVARLEHDWYAGPALACPRSFSAGQLAIWSNQVRSGLMNGGVRVGPMRCRVLEEREFNAVVEAERTKAAATERALGEHLRLVWNHLAADAAREGDGVRVVCDRQGGRVQYAGLLARALGAEPGSPAVEIEIVEESLRLSRYEVLAPARPNSGEGVETPARRMGVLFMPEAEAAHMPVAIASMTAKLTREMLMTRFNRYWNQRLPELKPTAGYRNDGWRWLEDLGEAATEVERRLMIRRA